MTGGEITPSSSALLEPPFLVFPLCLDFLLTQGLQGRQISHGTWILRWLGLKSQTVSILLIFLVREITE